MLSNQTCGIGCEILYIKMNVCLFVCMFVCTVYKSTFLNRSEPNFAHISPVVWKRPQGTYGPTIFEPFRPFQPLVSESSAESWAQHDCRPKSHCDSVISVIQQTTIARSYFKCPALWVPHRQHGEGNRMHACPYRNPMRQEGSE